MGRNLSFEGQLARAQEKRGGGKGFCKNVREDIKDFFKRGKKKTPRGGSLVRPMKGFEGEGDQYLDN